MRSDALKFPPTADPSLGAPVEDNEELLGHVQSHVYGQIGVFVITLVQDEPVTLARMLHQIVERHAAVTFGTIERRYETDGRYWAVAMVKP